MLVLCGDFYLVNEYKNTCTILEMLVEAPDLSFTCYDFVKGKQIRKYRIQIYVVVMVNRVLLVSMFNRKAMAR